MNQNPPSAFYSANAGISSTGAFVEYFSTVDPTIYDTNFPVQKRWFNTTTNVEWILIGFSTSSGSLTANWQAISTGTTGDIIDHYALVGGPDHTITSVSPSTAGFVLTSNGISVDPSFQPAALHDEAQYATFLVNPTPGLGTHTTISAAVADAVSGNTIWVYAGTYTEDVVGKAGITISAYGYSADNPSSVIILGNFQYSGIGRITLNGIFLKTNANYALSVTGTNGSYLTIYNGGVIASDHTGILFSTTGGVIALIDCRCNLSAPTGSAFIDASSADSGSTLVIERTDISNTGLSTTTNTSNANLSIFRSFLLIPLTTTGTANCVSIYSYHLTAPTNTPSFNLTSAGNNGIDFCFINSGSASCVIATSGTGGVNSCFLASGNALAIDAPSSLVSYCNSYPNNGSAVNCSQAAGALGLIGVPPSQFAIGQLIRANTPSGSAVTLTTNTPANVAQISLPPGTWTIGGMLGFNGTLTGTQTQIAISSTSATPGFNFGFDTINSPVMPTATSDTSMVITSYVVTVTTPTIYYLISRCIFTVGTAASYGTITAQRTG